MKRIIISVFILFLLYHFASSQQIQVDRVSGSQLVENSYILKGDQQIIVLDVLSSSTEAEKIIDKLNSEFLTPDIVLISHAHPDHFMGLYTLKQNFPSVKIRVANKGIKEDILKYVNYAASSEKVFLDENMFPKNENNNNGFDYDEIKILDEKILKLSNSVSLSIMTSENPMEAAHMTMFMTTDGRMYFPGDLVYNEVFPWLGPGVDEVSVGHWQTELTKLYSSMDENVIVYPGHGEVGSKELLLSTNMYIDVFLNIVESIHTRSSAIALIKKIYPNYKGEFLLNRSIQNWIKEEKVMHYSNVVDLTHTLDENFPYIPVPGITFPFRKESIAKIEEIGVGANKWFIHEHLGTQIDAPNHFIKEGRAMEDISLDELIVPIVVIDIKEKSKWNVDAVMSVDDILKCEGQHGAIPANACIVMNSGWEEHLKTEKYIGLDENGVKHFPGISTEAAQFLISQRDISGVGVDVISFDPGIDHEYKTHKIILGADKWALECLANLDLLPPKGATMIVGAPKVSGATGGLARVIAVW